jgi:hypothetical protein
MKGPYILGVRFEGYRPRKGGTLGLDEERDGQQIQNGKRKCTQNVDVEISVAVVAVWGTWA